MVAKDRKLRDFVRLYRLTGNPPISGESFSYSTDIAERDTVQALHDFLEHSESEVVHLSSGPQQISVPFSVADIINKPLSFNCRVPPQDYHDTLELFVNNTYSIHHGNMPDIFYIREGDYLHGQGEVPPEIQKVDRTCRLITFFEKVITHSELKANCVRFILLTHEKDTYSARKQIFETRFQYLDLTNLSGLEQLEQIVDEQDLHRNERFAIFRNTLADFLENEIDPKKGFVFILKQFDELKERYDLNYETYINKFAFNKFEMEVVSKSDELLQKLNTALNDIVTKVLVVPAALLALKALGGKNTISTDLMVVFAIAAIAVILQLLVRHQSSNLKQIGENIESVFSSFNNRQEKAIKIAQKNKNRLVNKKKSINRYLWIFRFIIWLPFVLCVVYLLEEYSVKIIWNEFTGWFTILFTRFCECFQNGSTVIDPNN